MKTILLAAGAAALALSAGPTFAAAHHKHMAMAVAGPKQPIPYSELNAYLKASPRQRMAKNWWSGENSGALATAGADTASANASATTSASPSLPGDTATSATSATAPSTSSSTGATSSSGAPMPSTPPVSTPSTGAANPSPTTTPGSSSTETTPPK